MLNRQLQNCLNEC